MFHNLLSFLNQMEETMNMLLRPLDLHVTLGLFTHSEDSFSFEIQTSLTQKNHILNSESELNRIHRAYFYYAFIIGAHIAAKLPVIPISLDFLPVFMKTKQTFQKSTTLLKEILSQNTGTLNSNVVFFISEENFDVEPLLTLSKSL